MDAPEFIRERSHYGVVIDQLSRIYKSWVSCIREYIANAESACKSAEKNNPDYKPEITITYNPEQCLLTIEDNGIGLSKKMFLEVFRYFGRSRNAFDPTNSGMFGLGAKSFVMLVGDKGSMIIHTKSRETNECFKMYGRKVGFDVLPFEDRDYGTAFTFVHDPDLSKLEVVEAIKNYSQYVRVPVKFNIVGNSVVVSNPRGNAYRNEPATITIEPSQSMISQVSPESVLDNEIKQVMSSIYRRGGEHKFIKVKYSTEYYDFYGLIWINMSTKTIQSSSATNNTRLLLISMPTEDLTQDLFDKAVIRIKAETGQDWLPKPTPDRERFEETSRQVFLDKVYFDLIERLPTLSCEIISYDNNNVIDVKSFNGIGKIESYKEFFELSNIQRLIWEDINTQHNSYYYHRDLRKYIPEQTLRILDTLHHRYDIWNPGERRGGYQSLFLIIREVSDNGSYVYTATRDAKRSSKMREKAKAATEAGGVVILVDNIDRLSHDLMHEMPVFRELNEVEAKVTRKMSDSLILHRVDIDDITAICNKSTFHQHIESMKKFRTVEAVAFGNSDNITKYIQLLESSSHTCPVDLFKATQTQIKWLRDNTKVLSLREYVLWAKKQKFVTSKGAFTLEYLLSNSNTFFHSIRSNVGARLLNYFKNDPSIIYVPVNGKDYFTVAAVNEYDAEMNAENQENQENPENQVNRVKIHNSSNLMVRYFPDDCSNIAYIDQEADRVGLYLYAKFMLGEEDVNTINAIIGSIPIVHVIRIVDSMIKLRQTQDHYRSQEIRPELLGQVFGEVYE